MSCTIASLVPSKTLDRITVKIGSVALAKVANSGDEALTPLRNRVYGSRVATTPK